MRNNTIGLALAVLLASACTNAGDYINVPGYYTGGLNMHFYVDQNGDGAFQADQDRNLNGVKVVLFPGTFGTDTMGVQTSNSEGNVHFGELPLGIYHFTVNGSTVGNDVVITTGDSSVVKVLARLDSLADFREFAYTYPTLSVTQAKAAPLGRTVAMRGKLLSAPVAFSDHMAFLSDGVNAIRIQTTLEQPTFAIGDSVYLTGVATTDLGQGILRDGVFHLIASKPAPLARVTTVTEARTANSGALDASLVQINGTVSDTITVNGNFQITVANPLAPTDKVTVIIDQLITVVHSLYKPTFPIVVRGVLVPKGDGTWVVRARNAADVTFP